VATPVDADVAIRYGCQDVGDCDVPSHTLAIELESVRLDAFHLNVIIIRKHGTRWYGLCL
jgi:hypothetical protein